MSWMIGLIASGVLAVVFTSIALTIAISLGRSGQLSSNRLGAATALVLLVCASWPLAVVVLMLLPTAGVETPTGTAMREVFGWPMASWSTLAALAVLGYWFLWRRGATQRPGTELFADLRVREQQALELNDTVLQGLVVAKMALDLDHPTRAAEALEASIESASRIITELLGSPSGSTYLQRSSPAAATTFRLAPPDEVPHPERKSS